MPTLQQREDREKLVEEIRKAGGKFHVRVPVQFTLAMKADLNLPWNKLRNIRRSGRRGLTYIVWSVYV